MNIYFIKKITNVFIFSTIIFGIVCCNKLNSESNLVKLNIEDLKYDNDFKIYISAVDSLKKHLELRVSDSVLSESVFIMYYIKAIKENDPKARLIISNQMGYNKDDFWNDRADRINILNKLNAKYDLSKVEKQYFQVLNRKKSLMFDADECLEIYKICKDNVTATYAMDQITCVTAGALGFTGIGVVVFVGCEAAAVYRMYQGDRNCNINFKYCK